MAGVQLDAAGRPGFPIVRGDALGFDVHQFLTRDVGDAQAGGRAGGWARRVRRPLLRGPIAREDEQTPALAELNTYVPALLVRRGHVELVRAQGRVERCRGGKLEA